MTVDKEKLKALAEGMKGWDKMTECWPCDENGPDWQVGRLDEEDDRWPLLTIDTEQYDQEQDAPKIAQYYAAANPAAVLALLAESDSQTKTIESIDKHLRGHVNDPDPLPSIMPGAFSVTTTYGLVAGIRRERDKLKVDNERLQREEKNDAIAYKAAIERQDEIRAERDQLKVEVETLREDLEFAKRQPMYSTRRAADRFRYVMRDIPAVLAKIYSGSSLGSDDDIKSGIDAAMSKKNSNKKTGD